MRPKITGKWWEGDNPNIIGNAHQAAIDNLMGAAFQLQLAVLERDERDQAMLERLAYKVLAAIEALQPKNS